MVELKNGILYKDGQPRLVLGLSYYPSYHPKKFPVLPTDDREGQLKLDMKEMAEAGFNLLRFAALGDIQRTGKGAEGIGVSFPLIDLGVDYADQVGMAAMVRLQGYTLNVSGYTNEAMVTAEGRELGMYECFLRSSLNHAGILEDNEDCTVASAEHFAGYPSLVSYQIYNEPAYHGNVDYNPHSIAAYRKWLTDQGIKSEAKAMATEPPRKRPDEGEDPAEWINWRMFHYQRLNWYMCHLAEKARVGNPKAETLTCHMSCPMTASAVMRGEDYYRTAEGMEILGITHYTPAYGELHYNGSKVLDAAESAAAVFSKHAWLVEYNARTDMPANEWDRETYSAVGSGIKGIMYYQWRADYPFPDGPEPNQFGILFNDRTPTQAFGRAVKMNRLINDKLSSPIALSEKCRAGVAILFSETANAYYDAVDHGNSRMAHAMQQSYRLMRKAGVPVDFVRAMDLMSNPLRVRLLIVPGREGLSQTELDQIAAFRKAGGSVVEFMAGSDGFFTYQDEPVRRRHGYLYADNSAAETLVEWGIEPMACFEGSDLIDVKMLCGDGYHIACLINTDTKERKLAAGTSALSLNIGVKAGEVTRVVFYTPDEEIELKAEEKDGRLYIPLPEVWLGAFVMIRH